MNELKIKLINVFSHPLHRKKEEENLHRKPV